MSLKILNPNETGKGILIEYDAGYVSPTEFNNDKIIKESINLDVFTKLQRGNIIIYYN